MAECESFPSVLDSGLYSISTPNINTNLYLTRVNALPCYYGRQFLRERRFESCSCRCFCTTPSTTTVRIGEIEGSSWIPDFAFGVSSFISCFEKQLGGIVDI